MTTSKSVNRRVTGTGQDVSSISVHPFTPVWSKFQNAIERESGLHYPHVGTSKSATRVGVVKVDQPSTVTAQRHWSADGGRRFLYRHRRQGASSARHSRKGE